MQRHRVVINADPFRGQKLMAVKDPETALQSPVLKAVSEWNKGGGEV